MAAVRRSASTLGLLALAAVTVVLCVLALRPQSAPDSPAASGQGGPTAASPSSPGPASTPSSAASQGRTVAVYGDAISAGGGSIEDPQQLPDRSWVGYLSDQGLRYVGGEATTGETTARAASDPPEVDADLHVAFLGLSDAYAGRSIDQVIGSLKDLQTAVSPDSPGSFVVAALGPARGLSPATLGSWNSALRQAATDNGWQFVDPWSTLRTDDFGWTETRFSYNATTPSVEGAKVLGANLARALAAAPSPTATTATS